MSYRTHCDWCGEHIAFEADRAVMPVTIHHRHDGGTSDATWTRHADPSRHFCVSRAEDDHDVADRAASERPDSCYDRAIRAITQSKPGEAGMGMEWRLMAIGDVDQPPAIAEDPAAAPLSPPSTGAADTVSFAGTQVTCELHDVIVGRLAPNVRRVLPEAGIVSLDQIATMTDDELLAIDRIGPRTVRVLRQALRERADLGGLTLAREIYDLLRAGMPLLSERDPSHAVLLDALSPLEAALGEHP